MSASVKLALLQRLLTMRAPPKTRLHSVRTLTPASIGERALQKDHTYEAGRDIRVNRCNDRR